jgi:peroxiredoxin
MSSDDPNDLAVPPLPDTPAPAPPERLGLAITALVLGAVSVALSLVVVGGVAGLAGAIVALTHLIRRRDQRRGMAVGGLILSFVGVVASVGLGVVYYNVVGGYVRMLAKGNEVQKWVGVESPDFTVKTMDGETFKLSDFRGKRVIVDSWATWCGPCVKEAPHFNRLHETISEDDLALVGISNEEESIIRPFLSKHNVKYPIASATDLPMPYSDVFIIPTTFFIDRNGIIQSVLVGYHDFDDLREHSTASDYEGELKQPPVESD